VAEEQGTEYVSRAEYQQDMAQLRHEIRAMTHLFNQLSKRPLWELPILGPSGAPPPRWQQWLKDYGVLAVLVGLGIPALFYLGSLYHRVQSLETQTRQLNTTVETIRTTMTGLETRLTTVETRVADLGPRIEKMTVAFETLAAKIQGQGEGLAQVSGKLDMLVDVLRQQGRSRSP
jgi:uncharacterized coiled-coil protein SlyX